MEQDARDQQGCTPDWVFRRYEAIRERMPQACFAREAVSCSDLEDIPDDFDVYVFDSFGVLNVGDTPIEGARARIDKLRRAGKRVVVLTNAATGPLAALPAKYARLGFDFEMHEIISSRELLCEALRTYDSTFQWGVAAPPEAQVKELGVTASLLEGDAAVFARCDGFILLSSKSWNADLQAALEAAVHERPRPVLVGNPDLAAPRENGLSFEPGTFAHALQDATQVQPTYFGKPFANAFDLVVARYGADVPRKRIAMVGDTLHTDILGAAAAGLSTILATQNGILRNLDLGDCLTRSGIIPDYIVPHI